MNSEDFRNDLLTNLGDSVREGDVEKFQTAFANYANAVQEETISEAKALMAQGNDKSALAERGIKPLTSAETKFYSVLAESVRTGRPMDAIPAEEVEKVMPKTVIDRIFQDLTEQHPLLQAINFQNVSGLIEVYFNDDPSTLATWGDLTGKITTELSSAFTKVELTHNKLSAFIPVANSMIDLGPQWLDRYVRTILGEAIALGLEKSIIAGTGKSEPIGMIKDISATAKVTGGVYSDKATTKVTNFDAATLGAIVAKMAKTDSEHPKSRTVSNLGLIVNTTDYWEKVMPATTLMTPNGGYVNDVLPIRANIIQSSQIESGKAVIGMMDKYFMGIGTGTSSAGKLEYSDQYQFLEDNRVYRIKLYGTGRAYDNNAFQYLDISKLEPLAYSVKNITTTTTTTTDTGK